MLSSHTREVDPPAAAGHLLILTLEQNVLLPSQTAIGEIKLARDLHATCCAYNPTHIGELRGVCRTFQAKKAFGRFPSQSAIGEIKWRTAYMATWFTTDRLAIAGPSQSGRASEEKIAANYVAAALQGHQHVGLGV
jgi:hypothetical protein